jgi:PAS domain-containing protein
MFARSPAERNRSSISDFLWTDPELKTNVHILDILPARYEIAVHQDQFFSTRHCNDSFPLEIAISTLPQCYGQTFLAIIRDITERRVAEEQAARQLSLIERASMVSRASLEAISPVTPAATILTINRAFSLMFGIALEDSVLMSTAELIEHFIACWRTANWNSCSPASIARGTGPRRRSPAPDLVYRSPDR